MIRYLVAAVVIALFSFPCLAQQSATQTGQPVTEAPAAEGADAAGRPVELVGNTQAGQVPETEPAEKEAFSANIQDVHFDFNKADIRPEDQAVLQKNAEWLKAHPEVSFTIEGDADERGDISYNVFLSDLRALQTRDALVKLGVPESRILYATGWGELYPVCKESDESCWSKNRRSHLAAWPPEDLTQRAQTAGIEMGSEVVAAK